MHFWTFFLIPAVRIRIFLFQTNMILKHVQKKGRISLALAMRINNFIP